MVCIPSGGITPLGGLDGWNVFLLFVSDHFLLWRNHAPWRSRHSSTSCGTLYAGRRYLIFSYCGGITPLGGLDTAVLPAGHSTQGDLYSIVSYCGGITPHGGLDTAVLPAGPSTQGDLYSIVSYCGGISPHGGLDTAVLPAGHSTQGDFYSIISYCGGISPHGGLDTVVLPAGHSTQGDLCLLLTVYTVFYDRLSNARGCGYLLGVLMMYDVS